MDNVTIVLLGNDNDTEAGLHENCKSTNLSMWTGPNYDNCIKVMRLATGWGDTKITSLLLDTVNVLDVAGIDDCPECDDDVVHAAYACICELVSLLDENSSKRILLFGEGKYPAMLYEAGFNWRSMLRAILAMLWHFVEGASIDVRHDPQRF